MHHLRGSPPQSGEIIALSHYDEGSHALMADLMGLLVDGRESWHVRRKIYFVSTSSQLLRRINGRGSSSPTIKAPAIPLFSLAKLFDSDPKHMASTLERFLSRTGSDSSAAKSIDNPSLSFDVIDSITEFSIFQ
ncbi:hypothetical protein MRB53_006434 [Persea americana]|uniref:Uncharacterized protein n=1 Tax=Persea americana TaxID=3435 RepID=A0ACC2MGD6_PERAE|nr:hypothetical protein MRB53_006434 [Persea americana]